MIPALPAALLRATGDVVLMATAIFCIWKIDGHFVTRKDFDAWKTEIRREFAELRRRARS